MLQFIIQKYKYVGYSSCVPNLSHTHRSCDGQLIVPSFCSLPNSLEELSKNYELIGDHQSEMEVRIEKIIIL